jgi:outer membrane biogenesis lipoprotein LolB
LTRRAGAVLACAVLGLAACVTPLPPEGFHPVDGEGEQIAALLVELRAQGDARRTLRAVGKVEIDSPNGAGKLREVILVERPARLRLETLNVLGQTMALLVTDGESYAYFDGERLDRGAASPSVLVERLGVDLAPPEAVRALLVAPLQPGGELREVRGRDREREVRLDGERVILGPDGELRLYEALGPGGDVRWFARYDDWQDVPGGRYPSRLELHFPSTQLRASFQLSRVELNASLDSSLFRVPAKAPQ